MGPASTQSYPNFNFAISWCYVMYFNRLILVGGCFCCLYVCSLIVLDHHKTALETLGDGSDCGENMIRVIDMGRSGATIAYDFFKEKLLASGNVNEIGSGCRSAFHELERARRLFDYIEDADLWRWCLQNSKAFSSGLKDLNLEFDVRLNPSLFQQVISVDSNYCWYEIGF